MLSSPYFQALVDSLLDITAAKMDQNVRRRLISVLAFNFTLVTLGLALTTLLAGITGNSAKSAAFLTVRLDHFTSSRPQRTLTQANVFKVQYLLHRPRSLP
jgi:uncharacterized BrkB/YihY/UPF0761 family membrane protein